jgi:hypothetical protein
MHTLIIALDFSDKAAEKATGLFLRAGARLWILSMAV